MAFRNRTIRGRTRQVRETQWLAIAPNSATMAAGGVTAFIAQLNAVALALRPFTVVRTHLNIHFRSDQVIGTEQYGAGVAMLVVSESASAVGITALPTPYSEQDSDLFYLYAESFGQFLVADGTGEMENGNRMVVDSKAMRKVNNDQDVVMTAETPSTVSSCIVHTSGRLLIKLH